MSLEVVIVLLEMVHQLYINTRQTVGEGYHKDIVVLAARSE